MKLALALRKAFRASGLSLSEFAERAGVYPSTAHAWLNGTHGVRHRRIGRVAKALKINVADLFV